jgi:hypothetical protein
MDAVTESIWELIRESADHRGIWVNMRRLWRSLSDWMLDAEQFSEEFKEIEAYGLIIVFPAADDSGTRLLIRKQRWFCPNCGMVDELSSEHMEPCLQRQRKLAVIRRWTE